MSAGKAGTRKASGANQGMVNKIFRQCTEDALFAGRLSRVHLQTPEPDDQPPLTADQPPINQADPRAYMWTLSSYPPYESESDNDLSEQSEQEIGNGKLLRDELVNTGLRKGDGRGLGKGFFQELRGCMVWSGPCEAEQSWVCSDGSKWCRIEDCTEIRKKRTCAVGDVINGKVQAKGYGKFRRIGMFWPADC
jgi:hypothetical protein